MRPSFLYNIYDKAFALDVSGKVRGAGETYEQAMSQSNARTLVDFMHEIQKGEISPNEKGKTFYRFIGSRGSTIDAAYDDVKHAGKHELTDEQIHAIEENSENFLAVYQETNRKGNYGDKIGRAHV